MISQYCNGTSMWCQTDVHSKVVPLAKNKVMVTRVSTEAGRITAVKSLEIAQGLPGNTVIITNKKSLETMAVSLKEYVRSSAGARAKI